MEFLQKNARAIVIAVLTVGVVAVFVANGDETDTNNNDQESSEQVSVDGDMSDSVEGSDDRGESSDDEVATPSVGDQKVEKSDQNYTISAVAGDSQTTLARGIVGEYSKEKEISLTAEQALFAETNLVNSLGRNDNIEIGDTVRLEESAVSETIEAAQALGEAEQALWARYL